MKNHADRAGASSLWTLALLSLTLLGVPIAPREAVAGRAPSAQAKTPLGLESVLRSARRAAKRKAWSQLEAGLWLKGTSDAGAVDSSFELWLERGGTYRYQADGPLASTVTFDGQVARMRTRSGPTRMLALGDRDEWHLAQWVHSGYWLDEGAPLVIALKEERADTIALRLTFQDSPTVAVLTLDRASWLPRALSREKGGYEQRTSFSEYEAITGIPIAHLVESDSAGTKSELRVLEGGAAKPDEGARYVLDSAPARDAHFDPAKGAAVELKQVRSGHLLVHPLVEGEDVGWFILDSGAGQSCIDPSVAETLGLESFGEVPAVGVSGRVLTQFRQGKHFELGPLRIDDTVYVELDLSFLAPVFGVEVAGICGYDLFARAVVELELAEPRLEIFDPASFELTGGGWSELVLDGNLPCIRCRFEGDRSGLFKLDLGDAGTVSFYTPAVNALGLLEGRELRATQVGGVGGSSAASSGVLEWFEIGGRRVEALQATFSRAESGAFANEYALGNLGGEMLKPFRIVFDYTHSRIALLPRGD